MAGETFAIVLKKLELRSKALAANSAELVHLEVPRSKLDVLLIEMKELTAQQASLTAAKQEVSKRLAELSREGQMLMTYVDVGVRHQYGNRAEKLVEFGQQPFRPQPRVVLVGPDGKRVKPGSAPTEPPAETPQE